MEHEVGLVGKIAASVNGKNTETTRQKLNLTFKTNSVFVQGHWHSERRWPFGYIFELHWTKLETFVHHKTFAINIWKNVYGKYIFSALHMPQLDNRTDIILSFSSTNPNNFSWKKDMSQTLKSRLTPCRKFSQFCLFRGTQEILTWFYNGGLWEKKIGSIHTINYVWNFLFIYRCPWYSQISNNGHD